jgi:hypothetical protein
VREDPSDRGEVERARSGAAAKGTKKVRLQQPLFQPKQPHVKGMSRGHLYKCIVHIAYRKYDILRKKVRCQRGLLADEN